MTRKVDFRKIQWSLGWITAITVWGICIESDEIILLGIVGLFISLMIFIGTERCRRNPETCRDGFVHKTGYTKSIVALWYFIGKPEAARTAIMNDASIHKKFVVESYIWSLISFAGGIILLLNH